MVLFASDRKSDFRFDGKKLTVGSGFIRKGPNLDWILRKILTYEVGFGHFEYSDRQDANMKKSSSYFSFFSVTQIIYLHEDSVFIVILLVTTKTSTIEDFIIQRH